MKYYNGQCLECGAPFVRFRIDKQFCTDACRMRMRDYRRAQKNKLEHFENLIERATGQEPRINNDLFSA
jgi:predicted nucleic acid-binding Zn ribbon protein